MVRAAQQIPGVNAEVLLEGGQLAQGLAGLQVVVLGEAGVAQQVQGQIVVPPLARQRVAQQVGHELLGLAERLEPQEHLALVAARSDGPVEFVGPRPGRRRARRGLGRGQERVPGRPEVPGRLLVVLPDQCLGLLVGLGAGLGGGFLAQCPHRHPQVVGRVGPLRQIATHGLGQHSEMAL